MEHELQAQGREREQERQHAAPEQVDSSPVYMTHSLSIPPFQGRLSLFRVIGTFEMNESSPLSRKKGIIISV